MTSGFVEKELFGGAMVVQVPEGFLDVSTLRPVPDHQEIFLSSTGFTSIAIDINERVPPDTTTIISNDDQPYEEDEDREALRYHFKDIIAENDIAHVYTITDKVQLPNFPAGTPTRSLSAIIMSSPVRYGSDPPPPPPTRPKDKTTVLLTLVRLVPQSTDLTITVTIPAPKLEDRPEGYDEKSEETLIKEGEVIGDVVLGSLKVRDWGLFVGGGWTEAGGVDSDVEWEEEGEEAEGDEGLLMM